MGWTINGAAVVRMGPHPPLLLRRIATNFNDRNFLGSCCDLPRYHQFHLPLPMQYQGKKFISLKIYKIDEFDFKIHSEFIISFSSF